MKTKRRKTKGTNKKVLKDTNESIIINLQGIEEEVEMSKKVNKTEVITNNEKDATISTQITADDTVENESTTSEKSVIENIENEDDEKEIDLIGTTHQLPEDISEYFANNGITRDEINNIGRGESDMKSTTKKNIVRPKDGSVFLLKNLLKDHGSPINVVFRDEETKIDLNDEFINSIISYIDKNNDLFTKVAGLCIENPDITPTDLIKNPNNEISILGGLLHMEMVKYDIPDSSMGGYIIAMSDIMNKTKSDDSKSTDNVIDITNYTGNEKDAQLCDAILAMVGEKDGSHESQSAPIIDIVEYKNDEKDAQLCDAILSMVGEDDTEKQSIKDVITEVISDEKMRDAVLAMVGEDDTEKENIKDTITSLANIMDAGINKNKIIVLENNKPKQIEAKCKQHKSELENTSSKSYSKFFSKISYSC